MGVALWAACGLAASGLARFIPAGRSSRWRLELAAAVAVALFLGVIATALDFGGWSEIDWRAGAFAFLGGLAAAGTVRATRLGRS